MSVTVNLDSARGSDSGVTVSGGQTRRIVYIDVSSLAGTAYDYLTEACHGIISSGICIRKHRRV